MIPAIFFTVDIQHALDLSAVLRGHGVRVYAVSGKTPTEDRKRLVSMARSGEIDGLASCDALTTGTDIPLAMMAVHARPTASGLWYRQATGRVLRPYPAPQGDRPYQRECLIAIYRALQRGVINQLVTMPTGTGKTVMIAKAIPMLKAWKKDRYRGRMSISIHRDELAQQTADTFARYNPSLKIGIEKADSYAGDADIVVMGIQTVGPAKSKRLDAFNPRRFDCHVTDEAHWGTTSVFYRRLYEHMGIAKRGGHRDPEILHLGMTATPNRADNIGLERHYDEITYTYPLTQAIRDGWLCRIVGYRAETSVDISKVGMRGEDFDAGQLENAVNTPVRNELIAQKYLEICGREHMDVQGWTPDDGWRKPHSIVLDCADVSGQHSLISLPSLFGLSAAYNAKGSDVLADSDRVEKARQKNPNLDLRDATSMDEIDARLQSVDLLAPPVVPSEVRERSKYAWLPDGPGSYHLGCMDGRVLTVRQNMLGQWEVHEHIKGLTKHLSDSRDFPSALRLAEKSLPAMDQKVLPVSAPWRSECPTEKQARKAWSLDVRLRREYATADDYFQHVVRRFHAGDPRYAKGGLERLINALQ